jgi:UDPglucose 6-dehydrogenase
MIGFVGLSHLGIVSSIAAAAKGFKVVCYDPDSQLCDDLARGDFPILEPGLIAQFESARERIYFSAETADLRKCQIIYLSLDVPTDEQGQSDLAPLVEILALVSDYILPGGTLIILSQVPPGFTRSLHELYGSLFEKRDIELYYQVETLIFGQAVERALNPERTIVGCYDTSASLRKYYADYLAAFYCPVLKMRYESAELTKISINMYLASSISVANTLAELCESIYADWSEVAPALKLDKRIGQHAYLTPGMGIGGGNLDRDLVTIGRLGKKYGTNVELVDACRANSRHRRNWPLRVLQDEVLSYVAEPVISIWGLTYKTDTQSTQNSPALFLINALQGCVVRSYDPEVRMETTEENWQQCDSALEACQGADALVVMTPWSEFSSVRLSALRKAMKTGVVIDPHGVMDSGGCSEMALRLIRLGVAESRETRSPGGNYPS